MSIFGTNTSNPVLQNAISTAQVSLNNAQNARLTNTESLVSGYQSQLDTIDPKVTALESKTVDLDIAADINDDGVSSDIYKIYRTVKITKDLLVKDTLQIGPSNNRFMFGKSLYSSNSGFEANYDNMGNKGTITVKVGAYNFQWC